HRLRRPPGQRAPADDPGREARAGDRIRVDEAFGPAHGNHHRHRICARWRTGPHRWSDGVVSERRRDVRLDAGERKLARRPRRREGDAMSEFLNAIKVDLLDSRRRPILAALVVAFVAALAYALLGGGSSSPSLPPLPVRTGSSGIPVSQAPANADQAVAETTSGASEQRTGSSRNPFEPLPGAGLTATATA